MDNIIGKRLDGRYEIQEIIGVGGMAVVYRAYDCIDDKIVAVKVLKEEYLTNEEFKRRFKNESKAIAVLSHPNIVKVFDVSFGDRLQYIVMEYIDGITLKEYIDQQKVLTWREAIHFTVQILRALQHAHTKGIVHRDIKPQNIMMLEDGTIKVTDFGIARFAHSETHTMTDKAIGSVHYISPEQARGAYTDEKSDIYSVGVMLFEMLTGKLPFEADSAVSVAIMQMQQTPRHPRDLNPSIPEGLEDITLRAMQKDPAQRYRSAAEMLADIDEFKRNPSIHFEYKYFVDESPTKYVDAINKIKHTDAPQEEEVKEKKTPIIPILSGIAGAVLLVALGVLVWAIWASGNLPTASTKDLTTPKLTGQKYDDVKASPQYKNFNIVEKTTGYNSDNAAGVIYQQDPNAGTPIKKGATINVYVSKGAQSFQVPDESNKTPDLAQTDLKNSGFTNVKTAKEYSADVTSGVVTRTDPAAGTQQAANTPITIYVSQGPDPSQKKAVPDLTGQTYDQAKATLENAGFKIGTQTTQPNSATANTVIDQKPKPSDGPQPPNTVVDIVMSTGTPASVAVTLNIDLVAGTSSTYSYHVQVLVDNDVADDKTVVGPTTSTIPAGKYTGSHNVTVLVNGKTYETMTVDFATGNKTNVVQNDKNSFIPSTPSTPSTP